MFRPTFSKSMRVSYAPGYIVTILNIILIEDFINERDDQQLYPSP